jgi:hypothetical protein
MWGSQRINVRKRFRRATTAGKLPGRSSGVFRRPQTGFCAPLLLAGNMRRLAGFTGTLSELREKRRADFCHRGDQFRCPAGG